MKHVFLSFVMVLGLSGNAAATVTSAEKSAYLKGYSEAVYQNYSTSLQGVKVLRDLIQDFVSAPTEEKFEKIKGQWIEARKAYSVTEVYRFYDGPIDHEEGPEGLINAWPLDEVYIDKVLGDSQLGIIQQVQKYPDITEDLLIELNEKDGEKNISTGWHAIEFLLWGQDLSAETAGTRPYTDYVVGASAHADRRGQYLLVVAELLVKNIGEVLQEWDVQNPQAYVHGFLTDESYFARVVEAARFLAAEELALERMFVAYDAQLQEDEQSCFSDTTNNDTYYNFVGIRDVLTQNYGGQSFLQLLAKDQPELSQKISDQLVSLESQLLVFQTLRFDLAIYIHRPEMKAIIDGLQDLGDLVAEALGPME